MPTRDILVHVIRTFVLVGVLAALLIALVVGCILLTVPIPLMFGLMALFVAAVVFGTARWHAYWAPIAKQAARIPWERADGAPMETIVEIAMVHDGPERGTYRASIYEQQPRKRVKRVMIGADVEFLGVFGSVLWFYIHDRYHARRDGLVAMDLQTGEWIYHTPQSELEFVGRVANRRGVIDVVHRGVAKQIDLSKEPLVAR